MNHQLNKNFSMLDQYCLSEVKLSLQSQITKLVSSNDNPYWAEYYLNSPEMKHVNYPMERLSGTQHAVPVPAADLLNALEQVERVFG